MTHTTKIPPRPLHPAVVVNPVHPPNTKGWFEGWGVAMELRFPGHTPNPYPPGPEADEWSAGYREGFQTGQWDHLDRMASTGGRS